MSTTNPTLVNARGKRDANAGSPTTRARQLGADLITTLSEIFLPIVNALAAAGIMKGMLVLSVMLGVLAVDTPTYTVLDAISSALFFYLPVFLAYTTAKRVGADPVAAILLAAVLLYPSLTAGIESGAPLSFFGLPVGAVAYPSSVIPIILGVLVLGWVGRWTERVMPEVVRGPLTPLLSLLVAAGAVLVVLGPLGAAIGDGLAGGYGWLHTLSPIVAGIVLGGLIQIMVLFGFHWALVPIAMSNIAISGSDTILAFFAPAVFAQAGAALAVCIKTRNPAYRAVAASATVSALFGITEPAMFGVALPLKKPLIAVCLSGAVGGGIVGVSGAAAMSFAFPGLATLPIFLGPGFGLFVIGCGVAMALSFTLTLVMRFHADFIGSDEHQEATRPPQEGTPEND